MKCLSVQIQPKLSTSENIDALIELTRSLGRFPEIDVIDDEHINLNYFSEDISVLWQDLKAGVFAHSALGDWAKKVAIVVCEAESDSDDYLLLYHYDPAEKLDAF